MKSVIGFLLVSFLFIASTYVNAAADKQIENALADINKYEQQFANNATPRANNVKRTLKLLTLTRERLDSSNNQTSPSWQEADQRYNNLVEKLNGFLVSKATPQNATNAAPSNTPAPKTNTDSVNSNRQMISQQRVRIKKIIRDIASAKDTVDKNGPKPFQDSEYVKKWQGSVDRFQDSLKKYQDFPNDVDVVAAKQSLEEMQNMMTFGQEHAAKELQTLGDVQARLKTLSTTIQSMRIPPTPQQPFEQGGLSQWLVSISKLRQLAVATHMPLPEIKNRAYLPSTRLTLQQGGNYDFQDVDRMERGLIDLVNKIDTNLNEFSTNLEHGLTFVPEHLDFINAFDPTKLEHQSKRFLSEGRADAVRASIAKDRLHVSEAAEFDKLLKRDTYANKIKLLEQVDNASKSYELKYQQALKLIRMPQPVSTDSELLKIASETLGNPKYEYVGDIKRLVINADKVRREKKTSDVEYDKVDVSLSGDITLSGTETTYFYEWEQFQVATAEPLDNKHYIFYTTLKRFTKGSETTPLNTWIISGRIKSSEIPEKNIALD